MQIFGLTLSYCKYCSPQYDVKYRIYGYLLRHYQSNYKFYFLVISQGSLAWLPFWGRNLVKVGE